MPTGGLAGQVGVNVVASEGQVVAATIQRVLAIPPHRFERNLVTFLTEPEADALLGACDRTSWTVRRDHTMLLLAIQTGLPEMMGTRATEKSL